MEVVILLGAPGSGKGTAAEGIKAATPYTHISTGNLLRGAIKAKEPLGLEAKVFMERGELVPNELIMKIITKRLEQNTQDRKYLLDGFPRTPEQAHLLDDVLKRLGGYVKHVFVLDAPEDVLIERISSRRVCRDCATIYHMKNFPPQRDGVCDSCGGEVYRRRDDSEATAKTRLDVFHKKTESLIAYYQKKRLLERIDAGRDKTYTDKQILSFLSD